MKHSESAADVANNCLATFSVEVEAANSIILTVSMQDIYHQQGDR